MDLLLDTHIALWALDGSPRLPQKAIPLLLDPQNHLFISVVSGWEVSIKHAINKASLSTDGSSFLKRCQESGYHILPFDEGHLAALDALDLSRVESHKDPFDRVLIAQAKAENMLLLTHDAKLELYEDSHVHVV